jgi:hypothetical protein
MSTLKPAVLALAFAVVAVVGCGGSSNGATSTKKSEAAPACQPGGKALSASLQDSLTASGDAKLRNLQTVKVDDPPTISLAGFKDGVYVGSAKLVAPSIEDQTVSWAVSKPMLTTGGGLAYPLDPVTREFSDLGAAAKEGSPARNYADTIVNTDAYHLSRDCVEGRRAPAPVSTPAG